MIQNDANFPKLGLNFLNSNTSHANRSQRLKKSWSPLGAYFIPSTKDSGFLSRVDFVVKRYFYFLIGQVHPLLVVVFISKAVVLVTGGAGVVTGLKQGAHKRPAFQFKRPANGLKTPNPLDK